nr:hypothetical protein L204_03918 [Cryptococcus depauperatus CBS 7855]
MTKPVVFTSWYDNPTGYEPRTVLAIQVATADKIDMLHCKDAIVTGAGNYALSKECTSAAPAVRDIEQPLLLSSHRQLRLALIVHVDDQLIACMSRKELDELKHNLNHNFECSDGGAALVVTPRYGRVTRLDIACATSLLSRTVSQWNMTHVRAARHSLRYLRATSELCLTFDADSCKRVVLGYADADWGGCLDTKRSTRGYPFNLCGGPVAWKSRRQPITALSTAEAELWLPQTMLDTHYGYNVFLPILDTSLRPVGPFPSLTTTMLPSGLPMVLSTTTDQNALTSDPTSYGKRSICQD